MRQIALFLALTVGCTHTDQLDDARDLWTENGSESYAITVQRSCFCPDNGPIQVRVVDGEVQSALRVSEDTGSPGPAVPIDAADYEDWFTVEGLFATAEEALADADHVTLEFDPDDGHPTLIDVDWVRNAIDDEASYSAWDYEIIEAE